MPFISVCPFCHEGKVRAPDHAVGLSATCPSCHSCFTLAPARDLPTRATSAKSTPASARLTPAEPGVVSVVPRSDPRPPAPLPEPPAAVFAISAPEHELRDKPENEPATACLPDVADEESEPKEEVAETPPRAASRQHSPAFVCMVLSLTAAGISLLLTQAPLGRLTAAVGSLLGLSLGLLALSLAKRNTLPSRLASGLNLFILLVLVLMPHWLGLSNWLPASGPQNAKRVTALGYNDGVPKEAEWVDVSSSAWQLDDIRVTVRHIYDGPVELTGPNKKKQVTKQKFLQIWLHVSNAGVERRLEFQGWKHKPGPDGSAPRLIDSAGKFLAAKEFDAGWEPPGRPVAAGLVPGRSADQLLVFESPAASATFLRLELPGSAIGINQSVRFHIPRSSVIPRSAP